MEGGREPEGSVGGRGGAGAEKESSTASSYKGRGPSVRGLPTSYAAPAVGMLEGQREPRTTLDYFPHPLWSELDHTGCIRTRNSFWPPLTCQTSGPAVETRQPQSPQM